MSQTTTTASKSNTTTTADKSGGRNNTKSDAPVRRKIRTYQALSSPPIQPKLTIGAVDDPMEREADQVAEKVMRMPDPVMAGSANPGDGGGPGHPGGDNGDNGNNGTVRRSGGATLIQRTGREDEELQTKPLIQRKCAACQQEDEMARRVPSVQREASSNSPPTVSPEITSQVHGLRGRGSAMSPVDQSFFAPRMPDIDVSQVRVHSDSSAQQLARSVEARAFTFENNVVMGKGEYSPGTTSGRSLMAHELTHVAQQGAAPGVARKEVVQRSDLIQRSDTTHHRDASVKGLQGIFSDKEIGQIYQHNWMRDLSQTPATFARAVTIWKMFVRNPEDEALRGALVKLLLSAVWNSGQLIWDKYDEKLVDAVYNRVKGWAKSSPWLITTAMVTHFLWKLWKPLEKLWNFWDELGEREEPTATPAFGGTTEIEHMDQWTIAGNVRSRWRWRNVQHDKLAPHILDGRAYIKENIAKAIVEAAGVNAEDARKLQSDAWMGATNRPGEKDLKKVEKIIPEYGLSYIPGNPNTAVIGLEAEEEARKVKGGTRSRFDGNTVIMDSLGRATHALEDFFAHSNFVEIYRFQSGQAPKPRGIPVNKLTSGQFDKFDYRFSFLSKILMFMEEMNKDRSQKALDHYLKLPEYFWPTIEKWTMKGKNILGPTLNKVRFIRSHVDDKSLGFFESHTVFAKDNDTDKTTDAEKEPFEQAQAFAIKANRYVFSRVKRAMIAESPESAVEKAKIVFNAVDAVIDFPSDGHPLLPRRRIGPIRD